jgi:hypothetical protein
VKNRRAGLDNPGAVYTGQPVALCDLVKAESGGTTSGDVPLDFGQYAFLAVAQRAGSDFLIGCQTAPISASADTVSISVAQGQGTVVPPLQSSCDPNTPLTQHCTDATKC